MTVYIIKLTRHQSKALLASFDNAKRGREDFENLVDMDGEDYTKDDIRRARASHVQEQEVEAAIRRQLAAQAIDPSVNWRPVTEEEMSMALCQAFGGINVSSRADGWYCRQPVQVAPTHLCNDKCGDPTHARDGRIVSEAEGNEDDIPDESLGFTRDHHVLIRNGTDRISVQDLEAGDIFRDPTTDAADTWWTVDTIDKREVMIRLQVSPHAPSENTLAAIERMQKVFDDYANTFSDTDATNLSDILTDLRHWADAHDLDWDEAARTSERDYTAEVRGE